jgi:peroxiredoxin
MAKAARQTVDVGDTAPDFQLEDIDGGRKSLGDIVSRGPALLAFYKVSCPTCQLLLPYLQRLRGSSVAVYAVCQNDAESAGEFARKFGVALPGLIDKASEKYPASNAYGLTHVPSLFLIEPDRKVSWASVGFQKKELTEVGRRAGITLFGPGDNVPESKSG